MEYRGRTLWRLPPDSQGLSARQGSLPEVPEGEASVDDAQAYSPGNEEKTGAGGSDAMLNGGISSAAWRF